MKQNVRGRIFAIILLIILLIPNKIIAISSMGGYTIESYDINMIVNENNTFDITEKIIVYFTGNNKHGIFRKIPLENKVERLDGTESSNRAKISNINVSEQYTTTRENGYLVLKIGDGKQTVSGIKEYTIKYSYNIGKDPLKDADELYFNLIGNEWDANINNVTFTIQMPKAFDESKLGFSSGYKTSANSSNVNYTVTGNTINGTLTTRLLAAQALTVRLTLPEGYFVGASNNIDNWILIKIGVSIFLVVIAYLLWKKYGKDDKTVETIEFYPPEGLNSAEVGFIYKGDTESKDVISLLVYLANKGYLKIEENKDETSSGILRNEDFKIIKLKDYDGENENEKEFMEGLFEKDELKEGLTKRELIAMLENNEKITADDIIQSKKVVTRKDLYNKFYVTINKISENMNKDESQEKIFEKASLGKRAIIVLLIIIMTLIMIGTSVIQFQYIQIFIMFGVLLCISLGTVYSKPSTGTIISTSTVFVILGTIMKMSVVDNIDIFVLVEILVENICMVMLIIFLGLIKRRTKYGIEMLGKINGFKDFLETAEKPRLEQLVMKNPEYFYETLPYAYVLGVSDKWMKKFEDIALKAPTWYDRHSSFSVHEFNRFMNSTYKSIASVMTSSPSSGGSGGGTGGGSSGGGSGGGGGGSW